MSMGNEFYVHSRVYSDTFRNKPYSMSMREDIVVTTLDQNYQDSDYYKKTIARRRARIERERAEMIGNGGLPR